jgi:hypothetical protein
MAALRREPANRARSCRCFDRRRHRRIAMPSWNRGRIDGSEAAAEAQGGAWRIRTRARHSHRPAAGALVANIPIACYLLIMPGRFGRGRAERHRSRCPKTKPTQETPHFQSVGFSRMRKEAWRRARQGAQRKRCPNRASGAAAGPGTPARPGLPGSGRDLIVGRSGRNPYREEPWRCRAKSSPAKPIRSPR